jgi:hypothetical protein
MNLGQYIEVRDGLMEKDLIAFDGTIFQVLDLPSKPKERSTAKQDPAAIAQQIQLSLNEAGHA